MFVLGDNFFAADHSYERVLAYEELTCYSVKSVREASLITATSRCSYHSHFYFFFTFFFCIKSTAVG